MKIALIHHTDNDGLMSGYLFWLYYKRQITDGNAVLIPYSYEKEADWMENPEYTKFVFGDITPPVEWLIKNQSRIENYEIVVTIYDHHRPKYEEIQNNFLGVEHIQFEFDDRKSGCKIIFDNMVFDEYKLLSILVDFVSDYDTWLFTQPDYEGINTPIRSYYKNDVLAFNTYMKLSTNLPDWIDKINMLFIDGITPDKTYIFYEQIRNSIKMGNILLKQISVDNEHTVKKGKYLRKEKAFFYSGYPNYDLLETIQKTYSDVLYWIGFEFDLQKNIVSFSIRSIVDGSDVIAKNLGGGGHKKAGGAKVEISKGMMLIQNPTWFFD